MIQRPFYVEKLKPFIDAPFVKILSGIRRCGKSTIINMIRKELLSRGINKSQILYFNFDSLQYTDLKEYLLMYKEIMSKIKSDKKYYIFIDEVQEIDEWERIVNSLMVDCDCDIYVRTCLKSF